MQGIN